jgi:dienelactone hydrolase
MTRSVISFALAAWVVMAGMPTAQAEGIAQREVHFYSEGVLCAGTLYLPSGYSDGSKVAAVVLAPGSGKTNGSLEAYAADLAAHGILAMTFDYRGWGKSGGFLYFGEPVRWDDRLRFSQTTTQMRIRRKRLEPALQVTDIRNALTFVEGQKGVDRARLGVWGTDLAGGHAIVVAGSDARVKALVAQVPLLDGRDSPRKAFAPDARQQAQMVKLARSGAAPTSAHEASSRNAEESRLALAEYHPYWYLEQIAPSTAVRFVIADHDPDRAIEANAAAASKVLKGPVDIVRLPDPRRALDAKATDPAIHAATEWFEKNL